MKKPTPTHTHIIKYTAPQKQTKTVEDVICFHLLKSDDQTLHIDGRHPNGGRVLDLHLAPGDRAIILSVDLTYYTNDTQCPIEMVLDLKFASVPPPAEGGFGGKHPDSTGLVRFILNPSHPGRVAKEDQRLYEPNFLNLGVNLLPFAGLEHAIMNPRSWQVNQQSNASQEEPLFEMFTRTDPLIVFIDEHRQHFSAWLKQSDITMTKDQMHYMVQRDALKRIRQFFKDAVFPLFHYTRGGFSLKWKTLGAVVVPEEVDYDDVLSMRNDGFSMVVMCLSVSFVIIKQDMAQFLLA